jgi:hypothetical protein
MIILYIINNTYNLLAYGMDPVGHYDLSQVAIKSFHKLLIKPVKILFRIDYVVRRAACYHISGAFL